MGVSVEPAGGGGRKSVDPEINLVPFIDMMSVMVAFLLITAVWTPVSKIDVAPGGKAEGAPRGESHAVAVLVGADAHWVGVEGRPSTRVARRGQAYDFDGLGDALRELEQAGVLEAGTPVEIAAEDRVAYQDVISTMDVAIGLGHHGVAWAEPGTLSVRFGR
jgi:biopolymer transport protein ExbD